MQPPWSKHPEIPRGRIGLRMGYGEEYYNEFYKWFSNLSVAAAAGFMQQNPEPEAWNGFYEILLKHPWKG